MLELSKEKYFSLREVAEMFNTSTSTISRWRREKKIVACKINEKKFMFAESNIKKFIQGEK